MAFSVTTLAMRTLAFSFSLCCCLALTTACPEQKPVPPASVPVVQAPPPVKLPTPAPAVDELVGTGSIEGEVSLIGAPPEMQPLKTGADPVCAKGGVLMDEAVLAKDGKLQNVVVRITTNAPQGSIPAAPVVVDQHGCTYLPRVQASMKGQQLMVKNSDGTLHNVHTYLDGSKTWFNQAQPPKGKEIVRPIDKDGVVKLKCDVHPWMTGFIVLSDHPFAATTEAGGKFTLRDVPAGRYTLEAWHERFGKKTQELTVKGGEVAATSFSYAIGDR